MRKPRGRQCCIFPRQLQCNWRVWKRSFGPHAELRLQSLTCIQLVHSYDHAMIEVMIMIVKDLRSMTVVSNVGYRLGLLLVIVTSEPPGSSPEKLRQLR